MSSSAKHAKLWSAHSGSGDGGGKHKGKHPSGRGGGCEAQQKHTNPLTFCLSLGFFAGLIWGVMRGIAYWFQFTKVLPSFLAEPFFRTSFLKSMWGYWVGIGFFIAFSMLCALLYYALFGRIGGPFMGVIYGLLWWVAIFGFVGPMMRFTPSLTTIGWNSLFTELCIFLLWGIFIGYSIAFEFTDEASREPIGSKAAGQ